jgi:hypothetical protein
MSSSRRSHADAPARLGDVETLRRLTRDAFAEITSVRDRLRDLERSVATERASRLTDRARVDSRVEFSTAVPSEESRGPREARQNRVRATTTVDVPFHNGDALVVRLAAASNRNRVVHHRHSREGAEDFPASNSASVVLEKLAYRYRLGHDAWVRFVMLGGEGHDAAATLNPTSKGASLTGFGSRGAAALARCRGPAVCFSRDARDGLVGFAGGAFFGDPSVRGSEKPRVMAQATVRPGASAAASIAVSVTDPFGDPSRDVLFSRRVSIETPALSTNVRLSAQGLVAVGDRALLGAWASDGPSDWGIVATAPPTETSVGWGVAVGRDDVAHRDATSAPLRGEFFLRLGGEGLANQRSIVPGIVLTRDETTRRWNASIACKVQFDSSA